MVKLVNKNGNVAVQYSYDAWGRVTSIINSNGNEIVDAASGTAIAFWNPLLYRGYVWDRETGWYYLQSRYYDPANHRFINADAFASTDETNAVACNMFAYCGNNPVDQNDKNGKQPYSVIGKEVGSSGNTLIRGWKYRIDSENTNTGTQRHIHVFKNGISFSQNEDGSPHDKGHNDQGPLPRKVQEALLREEGWDYNGNRERYIQKTIEEEQSFNYSAVTTPTPIFIPMIEPVPIVPFVPFSFPFSGLPFPLSV